MYRVYDLDSETGFQMESCLEDEFGPLPIRIVGKLSEDAGSSDQLQIALMCPNTVPVSLRIQELQHFLSLFSLFDPQFNTRKDGIPQIVSQAPPWPQNQP